jgi:hypothetical protein
MCFAYQKDLGKDEEEAKFCELCDHGLGLLSCIGLSAVISDEGYCCMGLLCGQGSWLMDNWTCLIVMKTLVVVYLRITIKVRLIRLRLMWK